jgi:hypothetical protein
MRTGGENNTQYHDLYNTRKSYNDTVGRCTLNSTDPPAPRLIG